MPQRQAATSFIIDPLAALYTIAHGMSKNHCYLMPGGIFLYKGARAQMTTIYTIGFSGKTRDSFLEVWDAVGIKTLADIRAYRVARFVPWASGASLANLLGECYRAVPELSPTKELLNAYKDGKIDWAGYEKVFNGILAERQIEALFTHDALDKICFLCSEKIADQCHRRLVAEYLGRHFPDIEIVHL